MNMLRKTMCAVALGATTLAPIMSTTVFAAPVAASEQQATANLVKQLNGIKSFTANFSKLPKSATMARLCQTVVYRLNT